MTQIEAESRMIGGLARGDVFVFGTNTDTKTFVMTRDARVSAGEATVVYTEFDMVTKKMVGESAKVRMDSRRLVGRITNTRAWFDPEFDSHTKIMFARAQADARNQLFASDAVSDQDTDAATDRAFDIASALGFDADSDQTIVVILETLAVRFPGAAQAIADSLNPEV